MINNNIETYPYQRMVVVHREKVDTNFLGIKNENWMNASCNLRPHALLLYLYLAANKDNYKLVLSPEAIRKEIGMPRSTYHDQFKILVDKGYLVLAHGNTYDFYEVPRTRDEVDEENVLSSYELSNQNSTNDDQTVVKVEQNYPQENIEINNKYPLNMGIDNEKPIAEGEKKAPRVRGFKF